jgi:hypothetical protein
MILLVIGLFFLGLAYVLLTNVRGWASGLTGFIEPDDTYFDAKTSRGFQIFLAVLIGGLGVYCVYWGVAHEWPL